MLPTLQSLEEQQDALPFSINFTQKLGRHALAKKVIPAGDLRLDPIASLYTRLTDIAWPFTQFIRRTCILIFVP